MPQPLSVFMSFAALPGDANYYNLTVSGFGKHLVWNWKGMVRASHACRQPLNGSSPRGPRPGPLQGCYAQRPVNSLWPAAPASLGHFVQRWSGRETQTGQQEKPLQRKVPGWQLRKETTKMTLKEDNQQSVTVKGLYQPAQKCGTQLRSNTATDAPVQ